MPSEDAHTLALAFACVKFLSCLSPQSVGGRGTFATPLRLQHAAAFCIRADGFDKPVVAIGIRSGRSIVRRLVRSRHSTSQRWHIPRSESLIQLAVVYLSR